MSKYGSMSKYMINKTAIGLGQGVSKTAFPLHGSYFFFFFNPDFVFLFLESFQEKGKRAIWVVPQVMNKNFSVPVPLESNFQWGRDFLFWKKIAAAVQRVFMLVRNIVYHLKQMKKGLSILRLNEVLVLDAECAEKSVHFRLVNRQEAIFRKRMV